MVVGSFVWVSDQRVQAQRGEGVLSSARDTGETSGHLLAGIAGTPQAAGTPLSGFGLTVIGADVLADAERLLLHLFLDGTSRRPPGSDGGGASSGGGRDDPPAERQACVPFRIRNLAVCAWSPLIPSP
jgi:hypothetical protein